MSDAGCAKSALDLDQCHGVLVFRLGLRPVATLALGFPPTRVSLVPCYRRRTQS